MKHEQLPLNIDTNLPLSINTQIKTQLKILIAKQFLKSGDFLPTTIQLGKQLSINKNTIQNAYSQLQDEGLLIMGKGIGTKVIDESSVKNYFKNDAYLSTIKKTVDEIVASGLDVEEILLSSIAYNQLFSYSESHKKNILFLECRESSCLFYLKELKVNTNATVENIDLADLTDTQLQDAINQANIVITQNNIIPKLQKRVDTSKANLIGVTSTNDISLLFHILQDN
ncbi:GntR family transcriptional regulator [Enterococcus hirae]|uniref:GntR family transcriptional regulator n=1 Tax=Enterococcus TaxID=1350 RepID=UPI0010220E24|nr:MULTISPECIES: GntR family transcriptional regulator [Enterococcus]MEB5970151.1 GntR family transcriptional regulator [Enterococcus gallinarum]RYJ83684.1 GntR family transcriptional regulator [Enterococcus faecium]HAQ3904956.1 GntR family transcriptional regulator [Enterococcus faecium]HAR1325072.1 GntR family transcriptional regulator [Enterococcus faecium]